MISMANMHQRLSSKVELIIKYGRKKGISKDLPQAVDLFGMEGES